jgi:hypothetical protein
MFEFTAAFDLPTVERLETTAQQKEQRDAARRGAPKQTPGPGPQPTPRGSEVTNTTPVETGDGADHAVLALRLKGTRPRLTLKRKEEQP